MNLFLNKCTISPHSISLGHSKLTLSIYETLNNNSIHKELQNIVKDKTLILILDPTLKLLHTSILSLFLKHGARISRIELATKERLYSHPHNYSTATYIILAIAAIFWTSMLFHIEHELHTTLTYCNHLDRQLHMFNTTLPTFTSSLIQHASPILSEYLTLPITLDTLTLTFPNHLLLRFYTAHTTELTQQLLKTTLLSELPSGSYHEMAFSF